jgi:hypothetical protein
MSKRDERPSEQPENSDSPPVLSFPVFQEIPVETRETRDPQEFKNPGHVSSTSVY